MKAGTSNWVETRVGMCLEHGDVIRSGDDSSAEMTFLDGSTIELEAGTEIEVVSLDISTDSDSATIILKQTIGSTIFRVKKIVDPASRYEVETPTGVVAIRGSVVRVYVSEDGTTRATNLEGDIWAVAQGVELQVPEGRQCIINPGQPPELEIRDWHDLDAIRDDLGGSYILMNDLDSTTAGYEELAGPGANGGKGWQPVGGLFAHPVREYITDPIDAFTGSLDGQGYDIGDPFINRPDEDGVGLFGCVGEGHIIENLGVVNAEVTGDRYVGGLIGYGWCSGGTVHNSYATGTVTGTEYVGGLVGDNEGGTVSNSYSTGSTTGEDHVGGLVGGNRGTVSSSYSDSGVTGHHHAGGLVGSNWGTVSNSYFAGSVTGDISVGGLVGELIDGTVSNSHYSYGDVLINARNVLTVGALSDEDFDQWLANDKFLDVNERLSQEDGYYLINDVTDFRQLLAFGQDASLRFRLENDLDLGGELDFYIPYLAGGFDGNGREISNLRLNLDDISLVGLFGYLAFSGVVTGLGAENVNITGQGEVGGLVGLNDGAVTNSYCTGRVAGDHSVGGLVGWTGWGTGTVSNSYYNYDEVLINGEHIITIGALTNQDFAQWLANGKFLDVSERLSQEDDYYLINDVTDFRQLLAFGQDASLRFRLENDLDLGGELDFYIPYLAGEFDGNGREISNLRLNFDFVAEVGLFGYLASGGKANEVGVENVNITAAGSQAAGGLVGSNRGTVSNSYSTGSVAGAHDSGGLVGWNDGTISDSYSTSRVVGGGRSAGGLLGSSLGTVSNSYSTGSVTGHCAGGLVGRGGNVNNSFWDVETSGMEESYGGMGKTTAEMQDIATFTGAAWDILGVASGERNTAYIWNIVDGQTYPFLSWQSVS